jgi:phosphate starvation-inducible PhoH-like protein
MKKRQKMSDEKNEISVTEKELDKLALKTPAATLKPQNINQGIYIKAMETGDLTICVGPAGVGKSYLAIAYAIANAKKYNKIIFTKPVMEGAEGATSYAFLEAASEMAKKDTLQKMIDDGSLEIAPIYQLQGRTLNNAFILIDEAQNTTEVDMKMALTRLGANSKMVVCGDMSQIALMPGIPSGLRQAYKILQDAQGVNYARFNHEDIIINPTVAEVIEAYQSFGRSKRAARAKRKNNES